LTEQDLGQGVTTSQYLARLAAEATTIINAVDYGRTVHELSVRRDIIAIGEDMVAAAYDAQVDVAPASLASPVIDKLQAITESGADNSTEFQAADLAAIAIERARQIRAGTAPDNSVSTGYADLDRAIGGFEAGTLDIIAARPGVGKTVIAVDAASRVAVAGNGVLFLSMEVPDNQIMSRFLSTLCYDPRARIEFSRILRGDLSDNEFDRLDEARDRLESFPLRIDTASGWSVAEIAAKTRANKVRLARSGKALRLVVLDYLKLVTATDRYKGNKVYEVGEISRGLKQLAKNEGVCVVLLAQLNRQVETRDDKRPVLSDLRESGDLEADADVVALMYREAYYLERSAEFQDCNPEALARFTEVQHRVELILGKNRAGPTKTINLYCDVASSHVSNLAQEVR
jgi:replicative DNA helicase